MKGSGIATHEGNRNCRIQKSFAELKAGLVSIAAILNKHGAGELWFGVRNAMARLWGWMPAEKVCGICRRGMCRLWRRVLRRYE